MVNPDSALSADGYPSPTQQVAALHAFLRIKNPRVATRLAEVIIEELSPSRGESVKSLANRLKPVMARLGIRMKHAAALEAAARIQGHSSWHATPKGVREAERYEQAMPTSTFPRAQGLFAVEEPEV